MVEREPWIVTLKVACFAEGGWDAEAVEQEIAGGVEGEEITVIEVTAQPAKVEPDTD
jgi:hypothetical protein